jgi:vacuolar-type H+-ATPase catalytic subunit A/Vma1
MTATVRASQAPPRTGRVRRVAGPLVEVADLPGLAMADIVALGVDGLPG